MWRKLLSDEVCWNEGGMSRSKFVVGFVPGRRTPGPERRISISYLVIGVIGVTGVLQAYL
jgi:hypothetical protein